MRPKRWTPTKAEAERQAKPPAITLIHTGNFTACFGRDAKCRVPVSDGLVVPYDLVNPALPLRV